jgi:hypothetical protein
MNEWSDKSLEPRPWAFNLLSAFWLMAFFGVWFAVFRLSPLLGIAVGVSIVPAFVFRVSATFAGRRRKKPVAQDALSFISQSCIWFSAYVLSIGPVLAVTRNHRSIVSYDSTFYGVVSWLHDNTFLAEPIEGYIHLWGGL